MITTTIAAMALGMTSAPTNIKTPLIAPGPVQTTVKFGMPYLECFKTTEAGEDEVYLIVTGRWSDGTTFKYRYPNETGHWDLNDGEGDPPIRDINLINLGMGQGSYVDLAVVIMEEDGGSTGGWAALAGAVVDTLVPEGGGIFSAIGSMLNFTDSDDYIGSFKVRVYENNDNPTAQVYAYERGYDMPDLAKYWLRWNMGFAGDGSNYKSQFSISK